MVTEGALLKNNLREVIGIRRFGGQRLERHSTEAEGTVTWGERGAHCDLGLGPP
jgi:hypothetical protein